jgi:hypothetical protein
MASITLPLQLMMPIRRRLLTPIRPLLLTMPLQLVIVQQVALRPRLVIKQLSARPPMAMLLQLMMLQPT